MSRSDAQPLPPGLHQAFADLAYDRFGLRFAGSRASHLDLAVRRAAEELGEENAGRVLERVRAGDRDACSTLASALTVGETYFFRQPEHFAFVGERLSALAAAEPGRRFRLWSAGCSSGEEAYSLALVARTLFGEDAASRVEILASDINDLMLARAREGVYREWSFRGVAEEARRRWFRPDGRRYRIADEVRSFVRFSQINLSDVRSGDWPEDVDVLLCRNVLVYFDDASAGRVAARLAETLRPGGVLLPGPADPLVRVPTLAAERQRGFLVYVRRGAEARGADPITPAAIRAGVLPAPAASPSVARRTSPPPARPPPFVAAQRGGGPLPRARDHVRRQELDAAMAALSDAERETPFDPEVYVLRSLVHHQRGEAEEALRDANRALMLDRSEPYPHVLAAVAQLALYERALAARSLARAEALLSDADVADPVRHADGLTVAELREHLRELGRGARPKGDPEVRP